MYVVAKTYGHDLGLSVCFRQHRAGSHCRFLHGYALSFRIEFGASELNERNWVIDFGALKSLKETLQSYFDHKLIVAEDDPQLDTITGLQGLGIADVLVLPKVGCEAFAELVFVLAREWIDAGHFSNRPFVSQVECREHGANGAIYMA